MGRFFKGTFIGGIAGFVLGLLYAPKKGEEMRRQLAKTTEDITAKVKEVSEGVKEKTEEVKRKAKKIKKEPGEEEY